MHRLQGQRPAGDCQQKGNVSMRQISPARSAMAAARQSARSVRIGGGRGEVEKTESLTVTIPVGVEDGMALRVAGRGMASPSRVGCRRSVCGGAYPVGSAFSA